ncbi:MAG: PhoH family protein [Rhodospirillales bacterium]|nr:PhoH family protein [Rhodospirillales bacterium]
MTKTVRKAKKAVRTVKKSAKKEVEDTTSKQPKAKKSVLLLPKNAKQKQLISQLNDEDNTVVFAIGEAGTGKTMIATYAAINAFRDGEVDKIVISRPAVSVDEQHGYLPGSLIDKMEPWVLPILDYFYHFYSKHQVLNMIDNNQLEIAPLAYLRGRNFAKCYIILDEAQNCTPNQLKMVLTRISEGSKMVITGDVTQHDRGFENNALVDFIKRFKNQKGISMTQFGISEVERHPIVKTVLDMYS